MSDEVELFRPSFSANGRGGSVKSSVFNLVSTICGGGVLSLPYAFQSSGWLLATFFLILTAIASDFSIYVLVSCSRRTGAATFEDVAAVAFGPQARRWSMVLVILLTFLAVIAYTILLRDLLASLVEAYFINGSLSWFGKNLVSTIACILILPACFSKQLTELKFLSLLSMLSIVVLAIAVIIRASDCHVDSSDVEPAESSFSNILHALPIFICTFVCHFNVLPLHGELEKPTRRRLHSFVHGTVGVTALIYGVIGISGYLYAECKNEKEGNILNAFGSDDHLVNAGRVGLSLTLLLSLPLIVVPCRDTLMRLYDDLKTNAGTITESHSYSVLSNGADDDDDDDSDDDSDTAADQRMTSPLLPDDSSSPEPLLVASRRPPADTAANANNAADDHHHPMYLGSIITVVIIATNVMLAFFINDVTLVWDLLGSTVSIVIAYLIPCGAYIRIRKKKSLAHRQILSCYIILIVSIVLGLMCTGNVIYSLASGQN